MHTCQQWKVRNLNTLNRGTPTGACAPPTRGFGMKPIKKKKKTRRFSNHESRLLSRAHTIAIIVILDLKIHQSMWIHWSFFPKTWTKGHWPLHDLWSHVCWGHMCDSTQGSLCPSPMTIHQCMRIQWSILQITTHILHTNIHTTYYVQNEWSHSLLLNSVQARQKIMDFAKTQKYPILRLTVDKKSIRILIWAVVVYFFLKFGKFDHSDFNGFQNLAGICWCPFIYRKQTLERKTRPKNKKFVCPFRLKIGRVDR